tara:strand:+ start:294 stop:1580 length:1287 start_codon:yes stop_codon:yes gene_type:complete
MLFYFIYFFISPLLFFTIYIYKFFNKKISTHFKNEKVSINNVIRKLSSVNRAKQDVLIFHAASAGEFEQLKPILKRINRSKYFIIQTFTSPTIFEKESKSHLFDVCCYHPYDFFWKSYSFFSQIKPKAYIVTRHDVWPSHLFILNKLDIKTFYINANLHNNSLWLNIYFRFFFRAIFQNIKFCLVPSTNIKNQFVHIIEKEKIYIMGDSRFDQIIDRKNKNNKITFLNNILDKSFNIIFGSYDEYDEKIIINSLLKYYKNGNQSLENLKHKIILVPHEINKKKINSMIHKLEINNFKPYLWSNINKNINTSINLLIVDQIGILADIYRYTKLAYVGSGFNDGVHSVIEPGVYGNVVSFGPNIELLDEAKYLYKNKIGYMIKNNQNMLNFFNLHKDNNTIEKLSKDIKNYIYKQQGASNKIIQFIEQHI